MVEVEMEIGGRFWNDGGFMKPLIAEQNDAPVVT